MEHIVFLTGRLAQRNLEKVLAAMQPPPFSWEVREIGLQAPLHLVEAPAGLPLLASLAH